MAVAEKTMEQDGFFEGVYDYLPNLRYYVNPENAHQYLPRLGGFDLSSARPELFGFLGAVDRHLGRLSIGYIEKNNLVQIGGQYWHGDRTPRENPVPDGYSVLYSRIGRGRLNRNGLWSRGASEILRRTDQEKSLYIDVLRASVATELIEEETKNDDDSIRWQKIARVGHPIGNAVLAMHTWTHSYRSILTGMSTGKRGELQPVEDNALAEQVFSTVYYWEET